MAAVQAHALEHQYKVLLQFRSADDPRRSAAPDHKPGIPDFDPVISFQLHCPTLPFQRPAIDSKVLRALPGLQIPGTIRIPEIPQIGRKLLPTGNLGQIQIPELAVSEGNMLAVQGNNPTDSWNVHCQSRFCFRRVLTDGRNLYDHNILLFPLFFAFNISDFSQKFNQSQGKSSIRFQVMTV